MKKPPELFFAEDGTVVEGSREDFLEWMRENLPNFSIVANVTDGLQLTGIRRLVIELLDTERLLEQERGTVKELVGKSGEFVPDGAEIKFQRVGQANSKSTGGTYSFGIIGGDAGNVPAVVSSKTERVFFISWETILRQAIASGIDNRASGLIIPG